MNKTSYNLFIVKYKTILLSILLIVSTWCIYWPVTNYGFVSFDDPDYITENYQVQKGLTKDTVKWAFRFSEPGDRTYWHPLTWVSHMIDHQLFGLNPSGHHIINVLIHTSNVLLIFLLLKSSTGAIGRSFFVAALFTLHPINVDTVAWIAERKNLLSSFFGLLSILIYIWYVKNPSRLKFSIVFACMLLSLLAKPMLATLPCILLLMDYWPLKRLNTSDLHSFIKQGCKLIKEKILLFLLSGLWIGISISSIQTLDISISMIARPLSLRISNAVVSYAKYIINLIWPFDLAVYYPYPKSVPFLQVTAAAFFLITVTFIITRKQRYYPWLLMGWLWYIGTLFPVLGITQNGLWPEIADRWAYIPTIGIFIIVSWGGYKFTKHIGMQKTFLIIPFFFCCIILITSNQISYWSNDSYLYKHAIHATTDNDMAHLYLGKSLMEDGNNKKIDEAIEHLQKAVAINRTSPKAYTYLGIAYGKKDKDDIAENYLKKSLQLEENAQAHYNLGFLFEKQNKNQAARMHYEQAIKLKPNHLQAHYNLGILLDKLQENKTAIQHFYKVLEINSKYINAHVSLGNIFSKTGEQKKSIGHYFEVLQINPDNIEAHSKLAMVFHDRGDMKRAEQHLSVILKKMPSNEQALINMANIHIALRNYDEAISYLQQIIQLSPDSKTTYYNIACLYALQNKHKPAVQWLSKALQKGYNNWDHIKHDPDLTNIRHTEEYRQLTENKNTSSSLQP